MNNSRKMKRLGSKDRSNLVDNKQQQQDSNSFDSLNKYTFCKDAPLLTKTNSFKADSGPKQIPSRILRQSSRQSKRLSNSSNRQSETDRGKNKPAKGKKKKISVGEQLLRQNQSQIIFKTLINGMDANNPNRITKVSLMNAFNSYNINISEQNLDELINVFRVQNDEQQKDTLNYKQFKQLFEFIQDSKLQ